MSLGCWAAGRFSTPHAFVVCLGVQNRVRDFCWGGGLIRQQPAMMEVNSPLTPILAIFQLFTSNSPSYQLQSSSEGRPLKHHALCIFFFFQSANRVGSPAPSLAGAFVQNFRRSSSRRHRFPSSEASQHRPLPIPPFERQIRTYQTQTARGYGDPTDAGDCPEDSGGHGYGIWQHGCLVSVSALTMGH